MPSEWPFLRTYIERDEVSSTSDLARELVTTGSPALPLAVRANRQTSGRGRGSNAWWSDRGSLTFTLAIDPIALGLEARHYPCVALASAVAIVEALECLLTGVNPSDDRVALGIRWPNDVEAWGRKLGGILPESVETESGPRLLIGIGINVGTNLDDAPPAVRMMATSVQELAGGSPVAIGEVFRTVLAEFGTHLQRLARDDRDLAARWSWLDTLRGRSVRVDLGTEVVSGVGQGIEPDGTLLVATERGVVRVNGGRVIREPPQ